MVRSARVTLGASVIAATCAGRILAASQTAPVARAAVLAEQHIDLARHAELTASIRARCADCAWDLEGREAVTLKIFVDNRYSQHLPLVRDGEADYRVLLGPADAGRHTVRVDIDRATTATALRRDDAAAVQIRTTPIFAESSDYLAVSLAPLIYARPDTVGRFTDVPVVMWYESDRTPRGTRYRYSVVFTNEDGGTPADRLMATWGRTTDIEYIYSVEVDSSGAVLAEDYQGPEHKVLPFRGTRDARHPLLWVATDNNMVTDAGDTAIRYAPSPAQFVLQDVSREAVMDANPWLYAVMAKELARERKIDDNAPPGNGTIPDPRRFVYVEACGEAGTAALAFSVGIRGAWVSSDRGVREYRIARDGCFRVAIPLPRGARATDVRALRVFAFERPTADRGTRAAANGVPPARLTHINQVFLLDDHFIPGPSMLRWRGSETIAIDGPPLEIEIQPQRERPP